MIMDYQIPDGIFFKQRSFSRSDRVADLLREEVANMLLFEIKDPRVQGIVTIISVKVTKDLRHADFFITVRGGEKEEKDALTGLGKASGFIRRNLGRRIRMRRVPELHFKIDKTIQAQEHLEELFKKIHEEG